VQVVRQKPKFSHAKFPGQSAVLATHAPVPSHVRRVSTEFEQVVAG
jgi:hypothetical protein